MGDRNSLIDRAGTLHGNARSRVQVDADDAWFEIAAAAPHGDPNTDAASDAAVLGSASLPADVHPIRRTPSHRQFFSHGRALTLPRGPQGLGRVVAAGALLLLVVAVIAVVVNPQRPQHSRRRSYQSSTSRQHPGASASTLPQHGAPGALLAPITPPGEPRTRSGRPVDAVSRRRVRPRAAPPAVGPIAPPRPVGVPALSAIDPRLPATSQGGHTAPRSSRAQSLYTPGDLTAAASTR